MYETEYLRYTIPTYYLPDFVVVRPDGHKIYIEAKGWFRPEDRVKMREVKAANPDLDIRLVFQRDGKVSKTMRCSDWCKKYNFPYCVGDIPKDWLSSE